MTVSYGQLELLVGLSQLAGRNQNTLVYVPERVYTPVSPQGINRYSYVFNNPLRYIDSQGNFAAVIVAGYFLLAATGVITFAALDSQFHWIENVCNEIGEGIKTEWNKITSLFSKGDFNRTKSVANLVKNILEHQNKISSSPNDPNRNKWENEIKAFIKNIIKELKSMGPNARQKAIEALKKHVPEAVKQFAKQFPDLMPK